MKLNPVVMFKRGIWVWFFVLFIGVGCSSSSLSNQWQGPVGKVTLAQEKWEFDGKQGVKLTSPHYTIYTTILDEEFHARMGNALEGALSQYRKLMPRVKLSERPMNCYVFAERSQWTKFTREHMGSDAAVYLKITRGAYCAADVFVAYNLGNYGTPSVAAHEGWHQFVSRHFGARIPPFLEEGISTLFEDIEWDDDLPRWNIRINRARVQALRKTFERRALIPLKELVTTHAGDVVGQAGNKIDAFYSQNWAFALFLWDAENAKYRPALQKMLEDLAENRDSSGRGLILPARLGWIPARTQPMLEYYIGMPLPEIEKAYLAYLKKLAFDQYNSQWED